MQITCFVHKFTSVFCLCTQKPLKKIPCYIFVVYSTVFLLFPCCFYAVSAPAPPLGRGVTGAHYACAYHPYLRFSRKARQKGCIVAFRKAPQNVSYALLRKSYDFSSHYAYHHRGRESAPYELLKGGVGCVPQLNRLFHFFKGCAAQ